jgi:uncharacterized protein involved in exopolysaccharide biosynthesis
VTLVEARLDPSSRHRDGEARPGIADDDLPVARVLAVLWDGRWRVLAFAVAGALLAFAATLVLPKRYTATASFTAESSGGLNLGGGLSGLAGLAGQFGVNLPLGSPSLPPDYFVSLARSRTITDSLLAMRVDEEGRAVESGGHPLLDVLPIRTRDRALRAERAQKTIAKMVAMEIDRRANIVTVRVTDRDPDRAAAIANRTLSLLNWHNVSQHRSRSRQQRVFAERRLGEAQEELREAERLQTQFLARNRMYRGSPQLEAEFARVQRQVQQKEDVVATLTQSYEQSRIAEAGDLPVLSVIDVARPPVRRSFPRPSIFVPLGLLLGTIAGLVYVIGRAARAPWRAMLRDPSRA